jgi:GntR family transcriptional regulator, transcriptional repressor for pyruvate dehydrogenase complex
MRNPPVFQPTCSTRVEHAETCDGPLKTLRNMAATKSQDKARKPREGLFDKRKKPSVKTPSIAVRIVDTVLDALLKKEARPGDFLGTEASISATFEASRFPVREALSRLEALGIIEIRRGVGGGIWIAKGNPDHFAELLAIHFLLAEITPLELFEARLAIAPKAAEHAALHAKPEDIADLTALLDKVESQRRNFSVALRALLDFHIRLVDLSKLRTLTALNRSLVHMMQALYQTYTPPIFTDRAKRPSYAGLDNLRLVVAKIEKRDAKGAGEVMHKAITGHRDAIIAQMAAAKKTAKT